MEKIVKTKKTLEYYDYHELVDVIEKKNNVDIRDYSGWYAIMSDQHTRLGKLMDEKFDMTYEERRKAWDNNDPRWGQYTLEDILREGELHYDEVEYKDYWHFMLDHVYDIYNGWIGNINWGDIREIALEEDGGEPDWRTKITDMFIAEVGDGDNEYLIEW